MIWQGTNATLTLRVMRREGEELVPVNISEWKNIRAVIRQNALPLTVKVDAADVNTDTSIITVRLSRKVTENLSAEALARVQIHYDITVGGRPNRRITHISEFNVGQNLHLDGSDAWLYPPGPAIPPIDIDATPQEDEVFIEVDDGGTSVHGDLLGRDDPDQHPVEAISGLESQLDSNRDSIENHANDEAIHVSFEDRENWGSQGSMALGAAKEYTDQVAQVTLESANKYTDDAFSSAFSPQKLPSTKDVTVADPSTESVTHLSDAKTQQEINRENAVDHDALWQGLNGQSVYMRKNAASRWSFYADGQNISIFPAEGSPVQVTATVTGTATINGQAVQLTAGVAYEYIAIAGVNTMTVASGSLTVAYNRDSMDVLNDLTIPASSTGPVASPAGLIGGLPMGVTARAVASQAGSGDPSPDNVRPISGLDSVSVWRGGRNLVGTESQKKYGSASITSLATGYRVTALTSIQNSLVYIDIGPLDAFKGKTLTVSSIITPSGLNNPRLFLATVNDNFSARETIAPQLTSSGSATVVVPSDRIGHTRLALVFYATSTVIAAVGDYADFTNLQLELGPVATPYAPYVGQTYPIALPETLYGLPGAVDEVDVSGGSGVRRTGRAIPIATDFTAANYYYANGFVRVEWVPYRNFGPVSGKMMCSHLPTLSPSGGTPNAVGIMSGNTSSRMWFSLSASMLDVTDQTAASDGIAAFLTWLNGQIASGTPLTVVYELAAPVPISIPPTLIPSLPGDNNVYSDAGGDTTASGRQGLAAISAQIAGMQGQINNLALTITA